MGFSPADDLNDVELWDNRLRDLRRVSGVFPEEPDISHNLKLFLKYTLGPQWQFKLVHLADEFLILQLRTYLRGHKLLTPFTFQPLAVTPVVLGVDGL